MNFITLHNRDTGKEVDVSADAIIMIDQREKDCCVMLGSEWAFVRETLPEIRALLNPMRAFAGKRDVAEAAEQDTRTKLLIEALYWLTERGAAPALRGRIEKEVGEAAIEQYMNSDKGS